MRPIRDLVYGVSGSGKTTWWLRVAGYLWRTRQVKTRWYLGDGGGEAIRNSGAEEFVEVMEYTSWPHPLATTQRICEGYWPAGREPGAPLIPTSVDEWARIGLVVFEGLTVMADYIMGDKEGGLAARMAKGEMLNEDRSFRLVDDKLAFGGNARTHYGFTQRRVLDLIERTRALPVHVGWTAHERKVEDEEYKEIWIGPDVSGKMLTTKIGASFGNTIHLQQVKQSVATKAVDPATKKPVEEIILQRRAYTRSHFDPQQTHFAKYFANTRVPLYVAQLEPEVVPEWIPADPIDYYERLARASARNAVLQASAFAKATVSL
jgi:hypothetical protein